MFFYCDYFVLNLFKKYIMKKVFKRTVMLSAALLMTSAMYAAVIGAGADVSGATGVDLVGCGDAKLRIYKCRSKNALDAGCGIAGTLENCVTAQKCSNETSD
jgi:hypothetical protein